MQPQSVAAEVAITPVDLLEHWQGHRRLTRRMIEAYPEDKLFEFSVGGMRPFGELAMEMLGMAVPMLREIVGAPSQLPEHVEASRSDVVREAEHPAEELLRRWDESTAQIDELWPRLGPGRFQETTKVFGQYEGTVWSLFMYVIDNEIHHRGQAYVYFRALGLEPPHFWERE